MRTRARCLAAAALAVAAVAVPARAQGPRPVLIRGATVLDGTGAAGRVADVRVAGGRIVAVAPRVAAVAGDSVVEGRGLVLAPGFVDTHSHHDWGLDRARDARAVLSQGVTTIVVGQDGGSHLPLRPFLDSLDRAPAAVNVASYAGHATIRTRVMGKDFKRMASDAEIARMRALLREELAAGALGLSTGLEYDAAISSATAEVVALARDVARAGGRYISHIRSEDRSFWAALDEIITIGREARVPVQVSHMKLAQRSLWGKADSLIGVLNAARASGVDITADVYPYTYWHSTLTVLFPDRDYDSRAAAEYALTEVTTPEGVLITDFAPEPAYKGKTLAEVARLRGTDAPRALMDLVAMVKDRDVEEGINAVSMAEPDVKRLLRWAHANVCSDGTLEGLHPRGWGSFPRVLAMTREPGGPALAEVIRQMTSLAAAHVGLAGRGRIAPGLAADLVLLDAGTVVDRATPAAPMTPAAGIRAVWVNGALAYDGQAVTPARAGRALRRGTR
jgi:N-acyl-D-amino-acid deacylase